jgi:hypothetical protein
VTVAVLKALLLVAPSQGDDVHKANVLRVCPLAFISTADDL